MITVDRPSPATLRDSAVSVLDARIERIKALQEGLIADLSAGAAAMFTSKMEQLTPFVSEQLHFLRSLDTGGRASELLNQQQKQADYLNKVLSTEAVEKRETEMQIELSSVKHRIDTIQQEIDGIYSDATSRNAEPGYASIIELFRQLMPQKRNVADERAAFRKLRDSFTRRTPIRDLLSSKRRRLRSMLCRFKSDDGGWYCWFTFEKVFQDTESRVSILTDLMIQLSDHADALKRNRLASEHSFATYAASALSPDDVLGEVRGDVLEKILHPEDLRSFLRLISSLGYIGDEDGSSAGQMGIDLERNNTIAAELEGLDDEMARASRELDFRRLYAPQALAS